MSKEYDELSEFAGIDRSEQGDYCCSLLCLRDFNDAHGMSNEFSVAIDAEIKKQLKYYKENSVVVEKQETQKANVDLAIEIAEIMLRAVKDNLDPDGPEARQAIREAKIKFMKGELS